MQLHDLVLVIDSDAADDRIVQGALAMANRHKAHLTVCIIAVAAVPDYTITVFPLAVTLDEYVARADAKVRRVEEAAARVGVAAEIRIVSDTAQHLLDKAPVQTRYADLVIVGPQSTWGDQWMRRRVVENVLLRSGRPVLLLPVSGTAPSFDRAVIGWNASDEAARAVHAVLPFLKDRAEVVIAIVNPRVADDAHGSEPGADLARHLVRHDLRVEVDCTSSKCGTDADILRDMAIARGADLLVLGAYARSRVRELVLGGVTHALMSDPDLPTLMMH